MITKKLENKLTVQLAYDFASWSKNNLDEYKRHNLGYMEGHTAGYYLGYENCIADIYGKEVYSRISFNARKIGRVLEREFHFGNQELWIDKHDHTKGLNSDSKFIKDLIDMYDDIESKENEARQLNRERNSVSA